VTSGTRQQRIVSTQAQARTRTRQHACARAHTLFVTLSTRCLTVKPPIDNIWAGPSGRARPLALGNGRAGGRSSSRAAAPQCQPSPHNPTHRPAPQPQRAGSIGAGRCGPHGGSVGGGGGKGGRGGGGGGIWVECRRIGGDVSSRWRVLARRVLGCGGLLGGLDLGEALLVVDDERDGLPRNAPSINQSINRSIQQASRIVLSNPIQSCQYDAIMQRMHHSMRRVRMPRKHDLAGVDHVLEAGEKC